MTHGEKMNKNIIIAILVVIIILGGAALLFGQSINKVNTEIKIIGDASLQNGEQVQFVLKDAQGNPISGQEWKITYNGNEKYSVTTDQNGKGYLSISGEDGGKYDVEVKYAGNDKYNGCTAKETLTITDDLPDNPSSGTASVSTASTDDYNEKHYEDNPKNKTNSSGNDTNDSDIDDTWYYPKYNLLVRGRDNTVIAAPNDLGIGMTVDEWIATYGPLFNNDTDTNSDNNDQPAQVDYNSPNDYSNDQSDTRG